jgi:NDP-sugar pyrophosphorylase family protein
VLLLLDSAASHPRESALTSSNGLINASVLLFSFTAIVQLMDQEVIASMKQCYRRLANEDGSIIAFKEKDC